MTRDEIVKLALEAKVEMAGVFELQRFAALVAAAEREACAKVCEYESKFSDQLTAFDCAAAIRARGESK